jgi:hypothetical protein
MYLLENRSYMYKTDRRDRSAVVTHHPQSNYQMRNLLLLVKLFISVYGIIHRYYKIWRRISKLPAKVAYGL